MTYNYTFFQNYGRYKEAAGLSEVWITKDLLCMYLYCIKLNYKKKTNLITRQTITKKQGKNLITKKHENTRKKWT